MPEQDNYDDEDGTTPLILSSADGHTICVLELLEQGADPNSRRATDTTPLFFAAQDGYLDVVKILIKAEASVDTPSVDGGTPLFVAAQGGHVKLAKELMDCGANVNACLKNCSIIVAYGTTPKWIGTQMGHDHICKVLLQNGANVDALRCDGATPLFKAAHKGHADVVAELLKHRPNLGLLPVLISIKLIKGLTALQVARQQKFTSSCEYLQD